MPFKDCKKFLSTESVQCGNDKVNALIFSNNIVQNVIENGTPTSHN